MSYLKERVAYLKGMAEGMQLSDATNEGKLLKAILEVMDDFALSLSDIEELQKEQGEQIDNIDEDLAEIERVLFDDEDSDCDDDCCFAEIECPHCKETISIDKDMIDDDGDVIKCPNCNNEIEVEWDCDCEDCNCEE